MQEYDYIVVGAGSAGCALAHRLAYRQNHQVLLIEQGKKNRGPLFTMPKGFGALLAGEKYVSRYQAECLGKKIPGEVWLRGKTLGGSSSVNGMIWLRPGPGGIDRLEAHGGQDWDAGALGAHLNALDDKGGDGGFFNIAPHRAQYAITGDFLRSCERVGLPQQTALTRLGEVGSGYLHYNIDQRGGRQSAATAFLEHSGEVKNLHVKAGLAADKVIFDGDRASALVCEKAGEQVLLTARKEIILSCGALESPLILQRSGIGNPELLEQLGIPLVHDNPRVGKNLREHLIAGIGVATAAAKDSENHQYGGSKLLANLLRYFTRRSGPMAQSPCHAAAFVKSQEQLSAPDIMLMFMPFSRDGENFSKEPGVSLSSYAMYPESAGEICLTSTDPGAMPNIQMRYLQTDYDRSASIAGLKVVRKIMAEEPLASRVVAANSALASAETDDDLLALVKKLGQPGFHAVGTCAMGMDREKSVVDQRTRVFGVKGLRVADCSILPEMISSVTNATVMAVAMRAADLILEDARHF
ncbi:GMC family oxidoreductase [Pseudohalioglobus lutimaris]|uniref:GMC oxidoreductase n=1 Tax=Pseudohalioglobus lutimaris TaxID=1737061 RepID=A0A2N5WYV3_9GAMM|nr:GMC family oxidoreductase [Pseudohalioglobus lutimaris]PLW67422.1 GMC oxidoreductase [Pseudohalioglobus lutimaris]